MAYAKSESMQPVPLIKAAVQLDLLEIGKEYTAIVVLRAGKTRSRPFVVLGCYPDYYSIRDLTNGRVETLRKSDIHCGIIKIEGLNIKEKVLEAVEDLKIKEAERVRVTKEMLENAIVEGYNWIIGHPGQNWFASDNCKEFDSYQRKKIIQGLWEKFVFEGHENRIRPIVGNGGTKGFNLKLKIEQHKAEDSKPDTATKPISAKSEIGMTKPEPIQATLESTNELLRLEKLAPDEDSDIWKLLMSTYSLLQITGKKVSMDIVFREV
jgi:hypothetical protein